MRYCKPASLASCFFNLRLSLLSFHFSLGQTHGTQLLVCCWHPTALATNLYINQTHISQGHTTEVYSMLMIICKWFKFNGCSRLKTFQTCMYHHSPNFSGSNHWSSQFSKCEPRICFNGFCYDIELRFLRLLNCHSSPGGWPCQIHDVKVSHFTRAIHSCSVYK